MKESMLDRLDKVIEGAIGRTGELVADDRSEEARSAAVVVGTLVQIRHLVEGI